MPSGLSQAGYISEEELENHPGIPSLKRRQKGAVVVIECIQDIPCNPCEESCKVEAITVGEDITNLPHIDEEKCIGCLSCIHICPGQAIFVVDESDEDKARISLPYEFLPLPEKEEIVTALERSGTELGDAKILKITKSKRMDQTSVITMEVPMEWSMKARAFKLKR
jgi:Fe-S-cluster-containing hydrogenase component 2